MRQVVLQLLRGFSPKAFRLLPRLRGKPPAAAKASPSFVPDPERTAFRRGPRSNVKQPKSAPLPAQIAQSAVCDTRPANTVLRQGAATLESSCRFPGVPPTLPEKPVPSPLL